MKYTCKICNCIFSAYKFKHHIINDHNISEQEYYDTYLKTEENNCIHCGNKTPFVSMYKGYRKYCCRHCSAYAGNTIEAREKAKNTCLQNHGVLYPMQSKEIIKKSENTCLKKYGDTSINRVKEIQEKQHTVEQVQKMLKTYKQTCLCKYGVENTSSLSEVKEKRENTLLKHYGVKNTFQSIKNIADIYTIQPEDLMFLPRMGEKSALNITGAAKASLQVPFERVLFALGIRFVGATVAKRLARAFGNIDALMAATFDDLKAVDEIGERIAGAVRTFFSKDENLLLVEQLKVAGLKFEIEEKLGVEKSDILNGQSIVISGVFTHHSRDEYKEMIERNGGKNVGSVSKSTSFILMGENIGPSKLEKAQKLGVRLVTEDEFLQMLQTAES